MNLFFIAKQIFGCETWSLSLREECRLQVFQDIILRRIFGPKREVNGEWKRLHNESLHSKCGIEPPGFVNHGKSWLIAKQDRYILVKGYIQNITRLIPSM